MADDKNGFGDYPFAADPSSEDEVLEELKRIIGESDESLAEAEPPEVAADSCPESPPEVFGLSSLDEQSGPDTHGELENLASHQETVELDEIISSIDRAISEAPVEAGVSDREETPGEPALQSEQHLVFTLAGIKYAVPTANVLEIGRLLNVTALPNVPAWLLGVTNRRGDILSVVNLKRFLGVQDTAVDSERLVVVRSLNDEMMTGVIVDQVNGVLNLLPGDIAPPAGPIEAEMSPYLRGLCEHKGDLVAVLDLELILSSAEMRQFELV